MEHPWRQALKLAGPDGRELGPDAFVFGNEIGERVASVRPASEETRAKA